MIHYGIKLWTTNTNYFTEVVSLYAQKKISFLELYVCGDIFNLKTLHPLQKIPITIHAPHFASGFNIFTLSPKMITLFKKQVIKTADYLNAKTIILHAGVGDNKETFQKNSLILRDPRVIIENKPKIGINNEHCFGYSLEQLNFIHTQCFFDICLDFGHAIKSACSQKLDYKKYTHSIIKKFKPSYFHLSDGKLNNEKDEHLNLGKGDYDLKWIKKELKNLARNNTLQLVFETPKKPGGIKNDLKNIEYFASL